MASVSLTEKQQQLFKAIESGDNVNALKLLGDGVEVNCIDETGMTPLSSAAYKGNIEIVEECIKKGADVNTKQHNHGYTPLMFAALAGKPDLCRLLMDRGAKSYTTNGIGKTACELAAFVGQHECVSIINNHLSIDDVDKFLHPRGADSEEQFPEELARLIHTMVSAHIVHPVALIFQFSLYTDLLKYRKKVLYVVDRLFERQLRCKETNEVMSLKLWIILHILREVYKFIDEHPEKDPADVCNGYVKHLLKMEPTDQVRPVLDTLLRGAIVSFPYRQSLLFETMVKALARSKFGERPSAYDFIVQGLFGQRLHAVSKFCATCGSFAAGKRCPKCRLPYCSQSCQKLDWAVHKKCCEEIAKWHSDESEEQTISLDDIKTQLEEIEEVKKEQTTSVEEVENE